MAGTFLQFLLFQVIKTLFFAKHEKYHPDNNPLREETLRT